MAAVLALVFVPSLAAILVMLSLHGGSLTFSTVAGTFAFVALLAGMLTGLFRSVHRWEHETTQEAS